MDIGQRIKSLRESNQLTQEELGRAIGVNKATVNRYETGIIDIKRTVAIKLAEVLNTTPAYLMGWSNEINSTPTPYNPIIHKIPVLGHISAGLPLYAAEHIEGYTYTEHNGGAEYFALKVKGDSMTAAHINDGSMIIVRRQSEVENGQIAVVRVDKEDATVKRFRQDGNIVQLIPQSYNPEHQIQIYDLKDTDIEIIGRVVECKTEF